MVPIRTHTELYRDYEIRLVEWLGTWQASLCPLVPGLRSAHPLQIADAARPSLEEALFAYRALVDRLIKLSS